MTLRDGIQEAWRVWRRGGWAGIGRTLNARLLSRDLWARYSEAATNVASWMDFSEQEVADSQILHARFPGPLPIRSVGWFVPDFYHPFYGGVHTILRFADYLQRHAGVRSHFFVAGTSPAPRITNLIGQAFPALADAPVTRVPGYADIPALPETDVSIATLWTTAYFLLKYNQTRRKFYFLQDYEALFYPAGSTAAQVEATYHFGFYGLANTPSVGKIYREQYGGHAECFVPCVDTEIFRPAASRPNGPFTIFFYGRPEHPRNGFELGAAALRRLKQRLGAGVRIVAAGAAWRPADLGLEGVVENLGLLGYTEAADLYRRCDAGLILMFTRHPSYLPLELMASGCLVVTNHNPATQWLLRHRENCLLAQPSATCLADALEWAVAHCDECRSLAAIAAREVLTRYSDWTREISRMYGFMCDPGVGGGNAT